MPTPGEKRRAQTRRPPHFRADNPESTQQNHLAVATAAAASVGLGAHGSSRTKTSLCRHKRASATRLVIANLFVCGGQSPTATRTQAARRATSPTVHHGASGAAATAAARAARASGRSRFTARAARADRNCSNRAFLWPPPRAQRPPGARSGDASRWSDRGARGSSTRRASSSFRSAAASVRLAHSATRRSHRDRRHDARHAFRSDF